MDARTWQRHAWSNRLQTGLLVLVLLALGAGAGALIFGSTGAWVALLACVAALLFEPAAAARLTLRLYDARPLAPAAAPALWRLLAELAERADLPVVPALHYVPSPLINAFAVGNRRRPAIALTAGLLRELSPRELAGVLAHEIAHIAHGDLRVMGLADLLSRLTSLFALVGQVMLLLSLPWMVTGQGEVNWTALLLLVLSPHLALLAQLGLSRVREFDADLEAVALTGDPAGLASALTRIERASRSWRGLLLPGWGNPEPSWLRTHPATEERVRRLQSLHPAPPPWWASMPPPFDVPADNGRRPPRWRVGGLWH
jgi:heat shock protein HtpX